MTTINDIIAARDAACAALQGQIDAARELKNNGAAGMNEKIDALTQKRADISAQAYAAALTDPEMTAALKSIKAATKDMNDTAAQMVDATSFLNNFNTFIAAANKIIPALKDQSGAAKGQA